MKKKLFILFCFVSFLLLGFLVKFDLTLGFDAFIYKALSAFQNNTLNRIVVMITYLGSTPFIICLNIGILILFFAFKKNTLLLVPMNSLLSVIFNNIFKIIFKRVRPSVMWLVTETGFSYPSGHTMIAVLFYGTLIIVNNRLNLKYKKIINIILLLIIVLISISRVYLGVHHITDIIGGYLLSLSIIFSTKELIK